MSQEVPGSPRRSKYLLGPRTPGCVLGGPRRSQEALGGPRRSEEVLGSPKEVIGGPRKC